MGKRAAGVFFVVAICLAAPPARGQSLVADSELAQINYYKFWQANLPLRPGDRVTAIHLVDEILYAITAQTMLYAVHADVGTLRWSASLGGPGDRLHRPTHVRSFWGRDVTLVAASSKIVWLDRATGELVASLKAPYIPTTPATSDGVRVFVGGMDAMLHCYEFSPLGIGDRVTAVEKWRVKTDGQISAAPLLWGGDLFFASHDGRVRACDAFDKARLWVFRSDSANRTDFHVDSTGVYFASADRSIYKLDVATGAGLWRFRTPGNIRTPPVIYGDLLLQVVEGNGLFAVKTDHTGGLAWHVPDAVEFSSAAEDRIYLLTIYGDILLVGADTGNVEARIYAGGIELVARNVSSGAMYLASRDGVIMCAQDKGVPYLRFEQVEAGRLSTAGAEEAVAEQSPKVKQQQRPGLTELLRSKSEVPPLVD